jgi:hypothetical protein
MRRLTTGLLLLALVGCKKQDSATASDESTAESAAVNESTAKPSDKSGKSNNPLEAMTELAKAGEALSKGIGQEKLGDVVNWRQLAPFAPEKLAEFVASGELDGSTGGMGKMQVSRVKRRYKAGKQTARLEITDTSLVPMLRAGFAMAAHVHEDSTRGMKKGIKVGDSPGMLEWRKSSKRAKVTLLVGGRYMVQLTLRPSDDPEAVMKLVKLLETGKLAELKPKAS